MTSPTKRPVVAVVSDAVHPYHRGGKETRYLELLSRLSESLDICVYTMHWWPERDATRREDGVEYQAICPRLSLYKGSRRSILQAIAFAFACLRLIAKRFDVVEADHMPYLHLFALRLVTKVRRRPLVVTWHEVWGPEYWRQYLGAVSGSIAWWIERAAMNLPDQIIAVSEGTADRLRLHIGGRVPISVIHNAINLDRVRGVEPAAPDEAGELLFVGRLLKHKGVDLLIDAVAMLSTAQAPRVLIVGDGPERLNLEKQVAELGLAHLVRFRASVASHAEVLALMKAARVFVFPSVREGFGIAPLEALACGTSVVTTSHPDNHARHLVARSDRGYLTEATVVGLAACIEKAMADTALGAPAETWIEEFDWNTVAAAYGAALADLIPCENGIAAETPSVEVLGDQQGTSGRRQRVVLIGPYGPERDGIARYSSELAIGLGQECEMRVVTPERPSSPDIADLLGDLTGSGHDLRELKQQIVDWSPDIVHVQFAVAAFGRRLPALLRLLSVLPGPVVVTAHEATRDLERMGWPGRLVYRRILETTSCVVVHTHGAAEALSSLCPDVNIRVLPHPVLPAPAQGTSEAELRQRFNLAHREVLLMFGFVHPHKGLNDLVAAFDSVRRSRGGPLDSFTIVVAGAVRRRSGVFRLMEIPDLLHLARAKTLVARLRLGDQTVFTGYVPDHDLAAWFRAAHTVVLPYRKTEQSGVLSLARAFDVPIVTSDAGGLGEESSATWTFPAGDRKSLAAVLSRLSVERPPRASFSKTLDLASFAVATRAVYTEVLSGASPIGCGTGYSE